MREDYQKEFFKRFLENQSLEKEKEVFKHIFGKAIWFMVDKIEKKLPVFIQGSSVCSLLGSSKRRQSQCINIIFKTFTKAKRMHRLEKFICPFGKHGFCLPLMAGDRIYGFIGLCNVRIDIPYNILLIFTAFTETIVKEVQKELELSELYDTIRPRAIALSTIHTIHRLISSTLDLDELLPRIARLSLQVLRAKQCSIMFFDQAKKRLIPKITIDLEKKEINQGKLKSGTRTKRKIAKTSKPILKPFSLSVPLIGDDVIGEITVSNRIDEKPFSIFDKEILTTLAEQAAVAIMNAQLYAEQEKLTIGSIKSLATILDRGKPRIYSRSASFVKITLAIANEMGFSKKELKPLYYAALLHDAGKVGIPEEILTKPSSLTYREYKIVKKHPIKGVEVIKHLETLKPAIPILLHHHERHDGTGYPNRLKKEEIPLGSKIMAVADAFDAMVCQRPYRQLTSISKAAEEIRKNSNKQFDPEVVEAFLRLVKKGKIKALLKGGTYGFKENL